MTNRAGAQFHLDPLDPSFTTSVCYSGEAPSTWWPILYQPYVVLVACELSIEIGTCSKLAEAFHGRLPMVKGHVFGRRVLEYTPVG
jgi:hypothetical protein